MAARGWDQGWVKQFAWARPIRDALRGEQEDARAQRLQIEEESRKRDQEKRDKARKDAIDVLEKELQMTAMARANAIGLSRIVGQTIVAAIPVVERLKESLSTAALDPKNTATILARVAYLARQGNEAARLALELERTRIGDPKDVLDKLPGEVRDMTPAEAARELSTLSDSLRRAKDRGWVVIDGELPDKAVGDDE